MGGSVCGDANATDQVARLSSAAQLQLAMATVVDQFQSIEFGPCRLRAVVIPRDRRTLLWMIA
jgi:hypothetical protein